MSRRHSSAACVGALATIVMALFAFAADAPPTTKAGEIEGWGDVIDPDGDSRVAGTGTSLEIVVPGSYHDLWPDQQGAMNAPRVLREAPAGDFAVEVGVAGSVAAEKGTEIRRGSAFRAAALLLWQDEKNFIRFDRASLFRDNKRRDFGYLHVYEDGKRTGETTQDLTAPAQPCRLKLQRRGEEIVASFSQDDGKSWNELPPQKAKLKEPLKVGVAALNSSNKPFEARFEGLIVAPTAR
jgi:regulation of enolase protein 1 (concanavalin A-like superfamily)